MKLIVVAVLINGIFVAKASQSYASARPADVKIAPWGNTYTSGREVTLSVATAGASIYYTTDGSKPTVNSTHYTAPIVIPSTPVKETISAIAVLNGVPSYSVTSTTYTVIPATKKPVMSVASGTYYGPFTVAISDSTPGATIYYTLDNSTPTTSSRKYSGALQISKPTNLRAMAVASGYTASRIVHYYYELYVPRPVITPGSGTYQTNQTVTISDSLPGAGIYYTTDGTTPTGSSRPYKGPFQTPSTGTVVVQAIAIAGGYVHSAVSQSTLTLALPPGVIANTVLGTTPTETIPSNFLGFTHDWGVAQSLMGTAALGKNQIYRTLANTLEANMDGPLVIRVGGTGTDTSGPATNATVEPLAELAQDINVEYILGVNLGSDNLNLAEEQASIFTSNLPSSVVAGLEIGNEPDLYASSGIRPSPYSYANYRANYQQWALGISGVTTAPIVGPAYSGGGWWAGTEADMQSGAFQAPMVTQHYYTACYNAASPEPSYFLLKPLSTTAITGQQPYIAAVHQAGSKFRLDELNSMCLGGQPGLSNSFSSALWGIDIMFEAASIGVDGVNWSSNYDGGPYDLFHFTTWNNPKSGLNTYTLQQVNPDFYALLFFSEAAGNHAQLLPASTLTGSNVKVWATVDGSGHHHLVIINKEQTTSGNVQLTLPGDSSASVVTLADAGGYLATTGVTIGGQTYDNSPDGTLQGSPERETINPVNNVWTIPINPMSAVLVNFQP